MIERTEPLERAVETWGEELQIEMVNEEAGELLAALAQHRRGRASESEVIEEIADLQIMLSQAAIIFGEDAVAEQVEAKLDRLEERLAKTQ